MNTQTGKWWMALVALAALMFADTTFAQSSVSASTMFMNITGQNGQMEGEVTQSGRQGLHRLQAYSHEIVSPRDAASGLPTGKRQHKPFKIVKLINKSSPLLLTALTKNETLPLVEISIWSPAQTGQEVKVLTYQLGDATVASIRPWMPNKNDPSTQNYPPAEEITFTYRVIRVTYHNGNISAEDDWEILDQAAKPASPKR